MYTFIFDIGKTNIKSLVLNEQGNTIWSESTANNSITGHGYTYIDVEAAEKWLIQQLTKAQQQYTISSINVTTHGACAVLLNQQDELVLPVLDYEDPIVESCNAKYNKIRPAFDLTHSPNLSAGLNLGRQLFWLKESFSEKFKQIDTVLMYPQYWVWRLTGIKKNEVTSLGCHTDLWQPQQQCYSSLVAELALTDAMPELIGADEVVGTLHPQVAQQTGISAECKVYAGIHDSNASFARYLADYMAESETLPAFTVVSTGTWIISMSMGADISQLDENKDMLANVSVLKQPLGCARFMGGREFEQICQLTGSQASDPMELCDIQTIIDQQVFAIPPFSSGSGPFHDKQGRIINTPANGKALATLYIALMIDYQLSQLKAKGDIVFGSISKKNPLLCQLIAQLRPEQNVVLSGDDASTSKGAWVMSQWQNLTKQTAAGKTKQTATTAGVTGLLEYQQQWLKLAEAN